MRNISASLTKDQFYLSAEYALAGRPPVKDVTRRMGWRHLKAGEWLQVVEKGQGLKKGEHPVRICIIEVVSVRREQLRKITMADVRREGFGECHPQINCPYQFIKFFCKTHKGCTRRKVITRIEFKYVV